MKRGPRGPVPSWLEEDEDDEKVVDWVFTNARDQLISVLQERIRKLEDGEKDVIFAEVRKELAGQMIEGNTQAMGLLLNLLDELAATCST